MRLFALCLIVIVAVGLAAIAVVHPSGPGRTAMTGNNTQDPGGRLVQLGFRINW